MSLTICPAYDRPEEVKALFLEYTDFLLKSDPSFAAFLELQNYDRELDHLEEKYGMPKGRLYLALVDDAIAQNPKSVADFKKGKTNALKSLVGQIMGKTGGRANPVIVQQLIDQKSQNW